MREAFDAILSDAKLPRREVRSNYGVVGVPIREQIVARHGDLVITRNSDGALCQNTADVLFAAWHWLLGVVLAVAAIFIANVLAVRRKRAVLNRDGGAEARALARVEAFSAQYPGWHLRVYRTPAGLRVLAMHRSFQPHEEDTEMLFKALGADHLYSMMCKVQHCFRARLIAKQWRIGIDKRITPPVAAWSAEHAMLPERLACIERYAQRGQGHAACRYLRTFGDSSKVDPKAEHVRVLHDEIARADRELPLA